MAEISLDLKQESLNKTRKRAHAVMIFFISAIVVIGLIALGLVAYWYFGKGCNWDQIVENFKGLCSRTIVWMSGLSVALGGIVSATTVQLSTQLYSITNFVGKVKSLNTKFDQVYTAITELFSTFRNNMNAKMEALENENAMYGQICNLLIDSCLDPEVKEKAQALMEKAGEYNKAFQEATEEAKNLTEDNESTGE